MGANFWWVFDLLTVLIIFVCIFSCAKKGFSKIIVAALGCAVSFAVAWSVSSFSAEMVYEKLLKKNNIEAVETALEDYNPEDVIKTIIESNELSGVLSNENIKKILENENSLDLLYEYANSKASNILDSKENFEKSIIDEFAKAFSSQVGVSLPPYVAEEILIHFTSNEELFLMTVDMLLTESDKLPEFIEENYIRGPAVKITASAIFLIVFFVLMTIIILVSNKAEDFGLLNGYDRLDRFAGGVMGIIEAIAVIMIMAFIINIIINMSEESDSFISAKTIDNTQIFKYFYGYITNSHHH